MRNLQTAYTRLGAPVTPRSLALAVALALGVTPLASLAGSIVTVKTPGDAAGSASTCTLRQAIGTIPGHTAAGTNCELSATVPSGDTINFDASIFPSSVTNTITLTDAGSSTFLLGATNLTIDASANGGVTIERQSGATNSFGFFNVSGGSLTLKHLTLINGSGAFGSNGGAICAPNTSLTLDHSTISGSSAVDGGAIWSQGGSVTLTNSTISGNSTTGGGDGGGIYAKQGLVTLTNSTVSGNSAAGGVGGGILETSGSLLVTNSTFSANNANAGGGIWSNSVGITLINSTFSGNSASSSGGISATSPGAQINSTNSIVAGNNGGDIDVALTGDSSGNLIGGNAQLGALADNGGPTPTMLPLPASPAIDAVPCTNAPATDQRGVVRPQGAQCDIGAVELGHPFALTVDTTADAQLADGKCSLREALVEFTQGQAGASDCPPGASDSNTILFAPALASQSITVATPLALNNNVEVTIDGSGAPGLAIDGGNATFIFDISDGSTVTIQDLQIVNGSSNGSDGGAIDNAGTLTLIDTAVNNNTSNTGGGAINNTATLNINHSTLSNNFTSAGSGGAINVQSGTLTMTGSTVIDNLAVAGGGLSVATDGTLNLTGSNVSTNHALSASGGGVAGNGHFVIANSTFSGNTAAADGGAIFNNKASNTNKIVNSTITANTAVNGGNLANAAGTLLLQNSIVANSSGGSNCQGTITPGTGFLTWPAGDVTCSAFTVANPLLGPLQDNGGPSFTMLPGVGSAAIDAGNTATCAAAPVSNRDQRGVSRPQGASCDIGAVEVRVGRIFADNFDGTPTP